MGQKIILTSTLKGFLAVFLLLIFYFSTVTLISGWSFSKDQFSKFWYFILILAFGFGIQVGLYSYLKSAIHQNVSAKILATSGATSTAAMISCCAHYLVNVLPILGATGIITFILSEKTPAFMPEMKRILSEDQRTTAFRPWESISQYQIQFFWMGLVFNFAGITYMAGKIHRFSKGM